MIRRLCAVLLIALVANPAAAQTRFRLRMQEPPPPTGGGSSNPLVAGRLPAGDLTIPNTWWAKAGVEGGIPSANWPACNTTQCQAVTMAGTAVTAAQINAAIQSASGHNGEIVVLAAGTYNISDNGIDFDGTDHVVVRGAGPDSTKLVMSNTCASLGQFAPICIHAHSLNGYYTGENTIPSHVVNWTAGYGQGSTQVTLSNTTGLAVGQIFWLDQLDEATDTGNIWNCLAIFTGTSGCTEQGGNGGSLGRTCNAGPCHSQHQVERVVSCSPACGGAGSTVVTVDRPIYMPNWRSGQSPGAWWGGTGTLVEYNGLEELSVDANAAGGTHIVSIVYGVNNWVKHVRLLYAPTGQKTHIVFYGSSRNTVRDSYVYGTAGDTGNSTHYGVEDYGGCDNLVENNIWQHRTSPFVRDGGCGSVYAYNYFFDDFYSVSPPWMQAGLYSHESGNNMILDESNEGVGIKYDSVHGTSHLFTELRNYQWGTDIGKNTETNAIMLHPFQRYHAFLCNVLGTSGYHNKYQSTEADDLANNPNLVTSIWRFRLWGNANGNYFDQTVQPGSIMRWGNWDVVSSSNVTSTNDQTGTRWVSSEVPTGDSYLPNPVPSSQSCPVSYYLSTKPPFWSASTPWPAVGPDVTGGNITNLGGHAWKIPAKQCYDGLSDDLSYPIDASGFRPKHFTCNYPLP